MLNLVGLRLEGALASVNFGSRFDRSFYRSFLVSHVRGLRRLCFERWRLAASAAGKKEAAKTEVLALRLMTEQLRAAQRRAETAPPEQIPHVARKGTFCVHPKSPALLT